MVRSWQWWAESRSSVVLFGNERASFLLAGSVLAGAPVGAEGLAPATRTYQKYRLEWLLPRDLENGQVRMLLLITYQKYRLEWLLPRD